MDIYYIDAIEDTEASCLYVNVLVYLFDNFPEMERYARLSMGTVFGHLIERITSMRFTTAKEKYKHFAETYQIQIYFYSILIISIIWLFIFPKPIKNFAPIIFGVPPVCFQSFYRHAKRFGTNNSRTKSLRSQPRQRRNNN